MTIAGGVVGFFSLIGTISNLIYQNYLGAIPGAIFAIAGIVVLIIGAPKIAPNRKKDARNRPRNR